MLILSSEKGQAVCCKSLSGASLYLFYPLDRFVCWETHRPTLNILFHRQQFNPSLWHNVLIRRRLNMQSAPYVCQDCLLGKRVWKYGAGKKTFAERIITLMRNIYVCGDIHSKSIQAFHCFYHSGCLCLWVPELRMLSGDSVQIDTPAGGGESIIWVIHSTDLLKNTDSFKSKTTAFWVAHWTMKIMDNDEVTEQVMTDSKFSWRWRRRTLYF